jgi:hypothetical protein
VAGALGLGAALAARGRAGAAPAPRPTGRRCKGDDQCDSGYCDPAVRACAAPPGPPASPGTGALTAEDPSFTRCDADPGTLFYYDVYDLDHPGGDLSLSLRGVYSGGGTLGDPYLVLYSTFDPADPCANVVDENPIVCGPPDDSYLSPAGLAAGAYTAVATSRTPGATGTYTLGADVRPGCGDRG